MKITVIEGMRLKNEIAQEVGKLTYTRRGVSYGSTTEDDVRVDDSNQPTIVEHMERATKLLAMSFEINNVLDTFNKENGIARIVRQIKNNELLLTMYDVALDNSVERATNRREKLENKFVTIKGKFTPFLTKTEIRKTQKNLKSDNRKLQSNLDTLNAQSIELEFSHENFEELSVSSGY